MEVEVQRQSPPVGVPRQIRQVVAFVGGEYGQGERSARIFLAAAVFYVSEAAAVRVDVEAAAARVGGRSPRRRVNRAEGGFGLRARVQKRY